MISKFKTIGNLGIFKNFEWDKTVLNKDGEVKEFKPINIIYGRNYSGKTTLSRILRALENGKLSEKFESPEFEISFKDEETITQKALSEYNKAIRVFNEDFVKEKLKFIIDPDKSIEAFAILGDNARVQEEIDALADEIGSDEEGEESGLHRNLKIAEKNYSECFSKFKSEESRLNSQMQEKAINNPNGIRYNSDKFGDQNYDTGKLKKDLESVTKPDFDPINNELKDEYEVLIQERKLDPVPELQAIELSIKSYVEKTKELVQKDVIKAGKIPELVKDALLRQWVDKGRDLHKGKRDNCAFCGNKISDQRWKEIEEHFDKESEQLKKDIKSLIEGINIEKNHVSEAFQLDKDKFYSSFEDQIQSLTISYRSISEKYANSLDSLIQQLELRNEDLFNSQRFTNPTDYSTELLSHWNRYDKLKMASDEFSGILDEKQQKAKELLRLREVYDFANTIKYSEKVAEIQKLTVNVETAEKEKKELTDKLQNKESLLASKKRELNDEEEGAKQVTKYLNDFFGHKFLSLKSVEEELEQEKKVRFEIIRDGKKAYHLSEGECNLISFCYFLAKLKDIETDGQKPIIWIDDPISSLDDNHIFFVYSLINSEILAKKGFEQIFISTHSLNFLKYLKRLPKVSDDIRRRRERKSRFFIINSVGNNSHINLMPKHLKDYVTEFNYLFSQIYKCSKLKEIDQSNFEPFYNYGNNARKFLEIFLFYKYPNGESQIKKLKKFFGDNEVPAILTDRINNEYSHLAGALERGGFPIEVPEMNSTAELIIQRIKELDNEQYCALMESIGVEVEDTEVIE